MSKFRVGDYVVPKDGAYIGFTPGSNYNLPRDPMEIVQHYSDCSITLRLPNGKLSPPVNGSEFELLNPRLVTTTKVTTTIVPGKYGNVNISPDGIVDVVEVETVKQLEDSIQILNQILKIWKENE